MMRFVVFSVASYWAFSPIGHAEEDNKPKAVFGVGGVNACKSIADAKARLECFDKATTDQSAASTDNGDWTFEEEKSELDRSRVLTLQLKASRAAVAKSPGKESAILVIRCAEGKTSVFVGYSALASSSQGTTVRYRIGDLSPRTETWQSSQNNKAYGLWTAQKSIPVIKDMIPAPDFYVRGETQIFGSTEATFNLTGLQNAIKPIREVCRW